MIKLRGRTKDRVSLNNSLNENWCLLKAYLPQVVRKPSGFCLRESSALSTSLLLIADDQLGPHLSVTQHRHMLHCTHHTTEVVFLDSAVA